MFGEWTILAAGAAALAQADEFRREFEALRDAKTPEEAAAVSQWIKERRDHGRAMQVARASAPITNITIKNHYW